MDTMDFMNCIYDILAQNSVSQAERDEITEVIDHVDTEQNTIVFRVEGGLEFELKLVDVFAPAKLKTHKRTA